MEQTLPGFKGNEGMHILCKLAMLHLRIMFLSRKIKRDWTQDEVVMREKVCLVCEAYSKSLIHFLRNQIHFLLRVRISKFIEGVQMQKSCYCTRWIGCSVFHFHCIVVGASILRFVGVLHSTLFSEFIISFSMRLKSCGMVF